MKKVNHFINDLKFNRTSQIRHIEVSNLMIQFSTITCQVDDLPAANNVSSHMQIRGGHRIKFGSIRFDPKRLKYIWIGFKLIVKSDRIENLQSNWI